MNVRRMPNNCDGAGVRMGVVCRIPSLIEEETMSTVDGMEASRGRAMCNIVSLIEEETMTMNHFVVIIK